MLAMRQRKKKKNLCELLVGVSVSTDTMENLENNMKLPQKL